MLNILATYSNQDGVAFPNTGAVDSSGALATDGTEFIAAMINDFMWGPMQSLLDYVDLTPNGTVESPSNSQYLEALRNAFGTPGEVFAAAFNDDPATLGLRCLKLIGQGLVRANYPLLDAIVYVGDANNAAVAAAGGCFFRADNADGSSPNTAGAYLIMPDMRGQVIRGLDTPAAVDPDGASRVLGHIQADAMQRITGSYESFGMSNNDSGRVAAAAGVFTQGTAASTSRASGIAGTLSAPVLFDNANSTSPNAAKTNDVETRMTNVALDFYIRY